MKLRSLTADEIGTLFPGLCQQVFGVWESRLIPSTVIVISNGSSDIAFVSGYWQDRYTFYIQHSGIVPEYRTKGHGHEFLLNIMDFIGAKAYSTSIPNYNLPAMKTVMGLGFIIIGTRHNTEDTLYVEFWRNAKWETSESG